MDETTMPSGSAVNGAAAPESEPIYHIALAGDWARACDVGTYAGGATCRADGFIHFSTRDQVAATLERFFAGRDGLVLLAAEVADLGALLRWEEVPSGGVFPHYHGALAVARLHECGPIVLGGDGRHVPPLPKTRL
jgi:uncharacterized protein (DUF952 family)